MPPVSGPPASGAPASVTNDITSGPRPNNDLLRGFTLTGTHAQPVRPKVAPKRTGANGRYDVVRVFFGTDRVVSAPTDGPPQFTSDYAPTVTQRGCQHPAQSWNRRH
ncbi:hypothetical protein BN2476_1380027 [Paraburkholderia piptadeniae]|uniref:Uncharacterized protein n=1 Tax=Paraburkholderia piptadeniae TaxID=1701573 RepID=A0A1N7SWN8_9BURK|nr:hypothetical protein BN2476_1380027 [Paraburkholderia piptadeniae]